MKKIKRSHGLISAPRSRGSLADEMAKAATTEKNRRRSTQLNAIRQMALDMTTELNLDTLLRSICSNAIELLGCASGGLYLYRPEMDLLEYCIALGTISLPLGHTLRKGEGLSGKILETGRPLAVDDYIHWEGRATQFDGQPANAVVGVPIRWVDHFLGVLNVMALAPRRFTPEDVEILSLLATHAAAAIENAALYERVRTSEERYRVISELKSDFAMSYCIEPGGKRVLEWVTDSFVRVTGWTFEDVSRNGWGGLVHPDDASLMLDHLHSALSGNPVVTEFRIATKAGKVRRLHISARPIWDADHTRIVRIYEAASDITERNRAEEALRESEGKYKSLMDQLPVGVYRTMADGQILHANPAVASMFGYKSVEELLESCRAQDVYQDPQERRKQVLEWKLTGGVTSHEIRLLRRDGKQIWVRDTGRVFLNPSGEINYIDGIMEDITEHKRMEEELLQAQKMEAIGRLAGGVAHDFNNLMQVMLSLSPLLLSQRHNPDRVAEIAAEMEHQVKRGAHLSRQLLLFSRRHTTKFEQIDLNSLTSDTAELLQRLLRENIVLRLDLATEQLPVEADLGQLEQVLINLALNATDAMDEGGTLTIRTHAQGSDWVVLSVKDTGHGIPEEIRERIFEPFFTTRSSEKGTGLGLSVVHGIVSQHKGRIEVTSRVGEGTVFDVVLPYARGDGILTADANTAALEKTFAGYGERVLLVEDEEAAREGLRDLLGVLGYHVIDVDSGEQAQLLPPETEVDVLLTDVMLPGISGSDLADHLKIRWPDLKIILMSGYTEDVAVRRGVRNKRLRFLQKPFDMRALGRELRAVLEEPN